MSAQEKFVEIYRNGGWGKGSGPGSELIYCIPLIDFLRRYCADKHVTSICDIGCGDMQWMPKLLATVTPKVKYVGVDCVGSVIDDNRVRFPQYDFLCTDITFGLNEILQRCGGHDLYIIKDVIQHWPNAAMVQWMATLLAYLSIHNPKAKVLVINCYGRTPTRQDIEFGGFSPVDFHNAPMNIFMNVPVFQWDSKRVYEL